MNGAPFALHITWTTYGTWLPGDKRGYVSPTRMKDGTVRAKQNQYGTPYTRDDGLTRFKARAEQKHATVWLNRSQAVVVATCLREVAAERSWYIAQAAVMNNHVHVTVGGCPRDGEAVRRVLKGTTQAALSREHGSPRRWWTHGGSDRYKFTDDAIEASIAYDERQEGMLAGIENMRVFVVGEKGKKEFC